MQNLQDFLATLAPHNWVLITLLLLALAACVCIIIALRRTDDLLNRNLPRRDPIDKPDWIQGTAFAIAVLGLFTWMNVRDARMVDEVIAEQQRIQSGYLPADRASLHVDINLNCGPRTDGHTDQLVMTIATDSDLQPRVTGCARIGQRMYQAKPREQVRG